jgi:integrase
LIASANHGVGNRWKARYVDPSGKEVEKSFHVKAEGQAWLSQQTAGIAKGSYVAPKDAAMTFDAWADRWLAAYGGRESTIRQAKVHLKVLREEFGQLTLAEIKPSMVKTWTVKLKDDYRPSTIYALYRRLSHVLDDVYDGYLSRNPCSRRIAPPTGRAEQLCLTTEQVSQLYDAFPEHLRVAILLGAFAGLRISEAVALRIEDVDFVRGVVFPKQQWSPAGPVELKTKGRCAPIPIPRELTLMLSASVKEFPGPTLVTDGSGKPVGPWIVEREVRAARVAMELDRLHFHCLRHHLATLLINSGCDVKTVRNRMRHGSAKTTSTCTGTCGRTKTTPPALQLTVQSRRGRRRLAMFLRALCGRSGRSRTVCPGQRVSWLTRRSTARTVTWAFEAVSCVDC